MVFILLGMHKSGTTLISKTLHESGINMGDFSDVTYLSYDEGSHYERLEMNLINKKLLGCEGQPSYEISATRKLNNDIKFLQDIIMPQIKELNKEYDAWGFKDPRTCLTYAFWDKLINKYKTIVIIRHPAEVWNHYHSRGGIFNRLHKGIFFGYKVLSAWYVYNKAIINILNNYSQDFIIIEYNSFMQKEKELKRLEDFVAHPLKDQRDPKLYRNDSKRTLAYKVTSFIFKCIHRVDVENMFMQLNKLSLAKD